jgi:TolB-like protein/Flp pilus assembly protein TadD
MQFRFANFCFDPDAQELRHGDAVVALQAKVFRFLGFLLENCHRTVPQSELLDVLWPGVSVGPDSLTRVVSLARRALKEHSGEHIVETRRGLGYRIAVPVHLEEPAGSADGAETASGGRATLAVLPFDNIGPGPDDDYFADGLSEDLITRMSQTRLVSVIARSSSFLFRGDDVDLAEVGRVLKVRYVVLGSVRREGGRVRVSAQLTDVGSRVDLWADRYDRELSEVFAAQDELAHAIGKAVTPAIWRVEQQRALRRNPSNMDAWDSMLRASWHLFQYTRDDLATAEALLRRATELDPGLSWAWADLANCLFLELYYGWSEDPTSRIDEAMRLAQRAVTTDDRDSMGHYVLAWGHLFLRDHEAARVAAERAVDLNPSDSSAHWALGVALTGLGRPVEGVLAIEEAIRLSPQASGMRLYLQNLGIAYLMAGQYERAADCAQRAISLGREQPAPHRLLAACHGHLGRVSEARDAMHEAMRLEPDFSLDELRRINHPSIVERLLAGWRKGNLAEAFVPSGDVSPNSGC